MKPHTMTDGQRQLIKRFVAAFKKLKDKKGDAISRNARLLDIRYRLTLDLRISIETEYSSTNTKSVHDVYELLFRFLDLWNVYEVCCAYGRELGVCGESKVSGWNGEFMKEAGVLAFLEERADAFRQELVAVPGYAEKYRQYLSHFSQLEAVKGKNRVQYQKYLALPEGQFDYRQLLFIQYMERNSYYHGGEAAKAGSDYGYRERQLSFYIAFLTELVAMLGAALFSKEKDI